MFRSSSYHTIDEKGRVIIPARFRDALKDEKENGVMITNMSGCIYAYTISQWEELEKRILSAKSARMIRFRRFFLGNSCMCLCDKQDRILIPQNLREYAQLEKDIVLSGNLDRFEIWSRPKWDAENKQIELELEEPDALEEVSQWGI